MGLNHIGHRYVFASQFLDKILEIKVIVDQTVMIRITRVRETLFWRVGTGMAEGLKIRGGKYKCGGHDLPPLVEREG